MSPDMRSGANCVCGQWIRNAGSPAREPVWGKPGWRPAAGVLTGLLLILAAAFPANGYEQRPNTVSIGGQAGVGYMSGSGAYVWRPLTGSPLNYHYGDFDIGPSLGIRIRYSLDRTHAIGISWEDQRFWRRSGKPDGVANSYQITTFAGDYYVYFNRPGRLCQYMVIGAGLYWDTFRFDDSDSDYGEHVKPHESPFLLANLGLGAEYFISRPFSVDLSLRGYYTRGEGGRALSGQLQLGFQYYLLR